HTEIPDKFTRRNLPLLCWDENPAPPELINSAQTLKRREIKKVVSTESNTEGTPIGALRGRRRNMKNSTRDKLKGSFHELKGTIKEEVGKVTSDPNLKAEGKAEKKAGKVQQRIGDAKEVLANLKGKLAELKKVG
ncbi:MAG: CsbD family protein, partial [Candidatus Sulfotelmatobacter sp.]